MQLKTPFKILHYQLWLIILLVGFGLVTYGYLNTFNVTARPRISTSVTSVSHLSHLIAQDFEFVNQIGGVVKTVQIVNEHAYIGQGPRLRILDISNPNKPVLLGQTETLLGIVNDVIVVDEIAYVATAHDRGLYDSNTHTAGLQTINVADPMNPILLDFQATTGTAQGLFVAGQMAYLADGSEGIWIVNISDPANLQVQGKRKFPSGSTHTVYAEGDRLYVANELDGLLILDGANSQILPELGIWKAQDITVYDVQVENNIAYIATGDAGLYIVNVADPQNPLVLGSVALMDALALEIDTAQDIAYVANGSSGLAIVDLSKPTKPILLSQIKLQDQAVQIDLANQNIYVADRGGGLSIVDVAAPSQPLTVRSTFEATGSIHSIYIRDHIAYVGTDQELLIYDLTQSGMPTELSRTSGLQNGHTVFVEGNMLYIADGYPSGDFHMADVSDPRQPIQFGRLPDIVNGQDIYVRNKIAYVTNHGGGLVISDVTNPSRPAALSNYPVDREANGIFVANNHAYVGDIRRGYHIVDISIPSLPTQIAKVDFPIGPQRFETVGNILYIAGRYDGFSMVDVTNPQQPVSVGLLDNGGSTTQDFAIINKTAYIVDGGAGLRVVDISAPSTPTIIGTYDTPGWAQDIQVDGDIIYVADSEGGLLMLRSVPEDDRATATLVPVETPTFTSTLVSPTSEPSLTPTDISTPSKLTLTPVPPTSNDANEPNDNCAIAQEIATNGTTQEHIFQDQGDVDWIKFDTTAETTYRIEVIVPADSLADVDLELYPNCRSNSVGNWAENFSPSVRIDFTAPTDGPVYLKLLNYRVGIYGDQASYQISVRSLSDDQDNRALIIVAGRQWEGDRLQKNIHHVTGQVYETFLAYGYTGDNIQYLTTDSALEGHDGSADLHNLEFAIKEWAADQLGGGGVLNLYMIDHGNVDQLYIDRERNQILTPEMLDGWLTDLEGKIDDLTINVIIEACQSGSFISPEGGSISGPGRVIVTSTNDSNDAYASTEGAQFTDQFMAWLHRGYNVAASFGEARTTASDLSFLQDAWLDADGDGVPNEFDDVTIASLRGFNYPGSFADDNWPPHIFDVETPSSITDLRGAIYADVRDDQDVESVWAVIYLPSYTQPETEGQLQTQLSDKVDKILLDHTPDGAGLPDAADKHRYAGNYTFAEEGPYRVILYAKDRRGLNARPVSVELTVGPSGVVGAGGYQLYLPVIQR